MASEKSEDNKKIIDVSHPDTTPAEASGRSVIVTNRPIIKDPMMVDENTNEDQTMRPDLEPEKSKSPIKKTSEMKLEPLTAPELTVDKPDKEDKPTKTSKKDEKKTDTKTKKETAPDESAKAPSPVIEIDEPDTKTSEKAEDKTPEKPLAKDEPTTEPATEEPKAKDEPETKPATDKQEDKTPQKGIEVKDEISDSSDQEKSQPGGDIKPGSGDKDIELADKEAAEKQAKHDEAIQNLTNSKKYALPINTIEKRRSKKVVVLGVVLSLLLILVWADIALDAGLIKINGVKPLTHFFSN